MKNETLYEKYIKDKDFERIMQQEEIIMDVTENFCEILEREKIKKSTLAKFMGKTKGYISQLLGGGRNLTLRSMADLAFHLGYTVKVEFTKKRSLKKQNVHVVNWNVAQKKEMSMPEIKVADDYQYLGDKFSRIAS